MEDEVAENALRLERIKAMTSPGHIIADAVLEACGAPLLTKTRITDGFSNEVYLVTTTDEQRAIVRIHWLSPHFEAEQWVLNQCLSKGLLVPRFLLLRHSTPEEESRSICVETLLEGTSIHALITAGMLSLSDAYPMLIEAGRQLARLHTIPTSGFGPIDANGACSTPDWFTFLYTTTRRASQAAPTVGLHPADVAVAQAILRDCAPVLGNVSPCLLHGDLSPQHILLHNAQFSGLIDFEFPYSGDPAREFAYWDFYHGITAYRGETIPTKWLLEGYSQCHPLDEEFTLRIAANRLLLDLQLLDYHGNCADQYPRFLTFIKDSLLRDLAEVQQLIDVQE